jgi:predicted sulfurtransferase
MILCSDCVTKYFSITDFQNIRKQKDGIIHYIKSIPYNITALWYDMNYVCTAGPSSELGEDLYDDPVCEKCSHTACSCLMYNATKMKCDTLKSSV